MQVAIHLGAHCTDDDRLLKTLLQNKGVLAKDGISVPGPGRYRDSVKKTLAKLRGAPASPDTQDMLLESILDNETTERLVLANEDFICVHGRIFENHILYDKSGYKTNWLRNLLPDAEFEFFLGIRNPATFIPAAFKHPKQKQKDFSYFLNNADVTDILWSDVLVSIQEANPGCPVTVWCNEDTPLIWPEVIGEVSGFENYGALQGGYNVLSSIMSDVGMRRLHTYLDTHPPQTEIQRRRIVTAFLDKFALAEEIEEELDVPGWTEELVVELTDIYEEDIFDIQKMPGVKFISL